MKTRCAVPMFAAIVLCLPVAVSAQQKPWNADVTLGWMGLVDDSTKNYPVIGGSITRRVAPRLSIGPEFVLMNNSDLVTDRILMVTANVVFDLVASDSSNPPRIVPFVVGGVGLFRGRDQVRNGPFWHTDPAFTAGAGLRTRVSDAVSVGVEYRLGWELHHRLTAAVGLAF